MIYDMLGRFDCSLLADIIDSDHLDWCLVLFRVRIRLIAIGSERSSMRSLGWLGRTMLV